MKTLKVIAEFKEVLYQSIGRDKYKTFDKHIGNLIYPCIVLDDMFIYENYTKTEDGFTVWLSIHVFSSSSSMREVIEINDFLYEKIHQICEEENWIPYMEIVQMKMHNLVFRKEMDTNGSTPIQHSIMNVDFELKDKINM